MNYEKKLGIARKLASLVGEGETILIESGSVNALLARELLKIKKVTIITTNVYIARQFRKSDQANIIILGGIYQHDSETLVGKITKTCIDQINIDKAFIGIDGYTTTRDLPCAISSGLKFQVTSFKRQKMFMSFPIRVNLGKPN